MTKRATCSACNRPISVCYCHTVKPVDNQWPVYILQHPSESKHPVGTAAIAARSLINCQLQIAEHFQPDSFNRSVQQAVLVYPSDEAVSLDSLSQGEPKTLIFLDASWRKSYRMLMESPELQALPKLGLQPKQPSRYKIRQSKQSGSLSTLEAIAYTLGALEQDDEKYRPLLNSMDWMIEKQISLMGEAVFRRNYGD